MSTLANKVHVPLAVRRVTCNHMHFAQKCGHTPAPGALSLVGPQYLGQGHMHAAQRCAHTPAPGGLSLQVLKSCPAAEVAPPEGALALVPLLLLGQVGPDHVRTICEKQ